jgi:hypothetical protein
MIFRTVAKHLPSKVIHPLVMVIVLIVVIKTVDFLDCVNCNCHAELVVSMNSHWIGVVDKCEGLVEITNVSKYVLEATIDTRGSTVSMCSWSNFGRSKNLENQENFILENFHSLVCTNGSIVRCMEPCECSAFTFFCRPRNALAHIVALVAIQWIEISEGMKMQLFWMCLLYVEIFFTRQNTAKRHSKAMHA